MDKYLLWCEVLGDSNYYDSFFAVYETEAEALAEMKTALAKYDSEHEINKKTTEFYFNNSKSVFTCEAYAHDDTHINIDVRPLVMKNKYNYML